MINENLHQGDDSWLKRSIHLLYLWVLTNCTFNGPLTIAYDVVPLLHALTFERERRVRELFL